METIKRDDGHHDNSHLILQDASIMIARPIRETIDITRRSNTLVEKDGPFSCRISS